MSQTTQIQSVSGSGKSHCHTAGFMVTGNNDQCFSGMFFSKLNSHTDSIIQSDHFPEISGSFIAVTTPVDRSAFNHHKESGRIVQELDPFGCKLSQRRQRRVCIDFIRQTSTGTAGKNFSATGLQIQQIFFGVDNFISGFRCKFINITFVVRRFFIIMLADSAASEIIKSGSDQIQSDRIILGTIFTVSIKSGRCGMIDRDGCNDPDFLSFAFCNFSNRLQIPFSGGIHSDSAIFCFLTTCDCSCSSGGICDQCIGGRGPCGCMIRKTVDRKRTMPDNTRKLFCNHPLRSRHSIPDEQKYIFRILGTQTHYCKKQQQRQHVSFHDSKLLFIKKLIVFLKINLIQHTQNCNIK